MLHTEVQVLSGPCSVFTPQAASYITPDRQEDRLSPRWGLRYLGARHSFFFGLLLLSQLGLKKPTYYLTSKLAGVPVRPHNKSSEGHFILQKHTARHHHVMRCKEAALFHFCEIKEELQLQFYLRFGKSCQKFLLSTWRRVISYFHLPPPESSTPIRGGHLQVVSH